MALPPPSAKPAFITFADNSILTFDAVNNDVPSWDSTFSRYPNELGRSVTSHIHQNPRTRSMTIFFTDSPLRAGETPSGDRARALFTRLLAAWEQREIFTLSSTVFTDADMGIQHMDAPRTSSTGRMITVNVNFEKITTITPIDTFIIPARLVQKRRPKVDKGKESGQRPEDKPEKGSLLKSIADEQSKNGNLERIATAIEASTAFLSGG